MFAAPSSKGSTMFTGSTKNPTPKIPQPERLDEVYSALRRGLQSYLQVHQLELDSLGQQIRESRKNGRLGSLYELDKQVKAIERFMRRLEFHLSKVEELYDAYRMQRRLRDGASKMVTAFNSASGSKEARESLSEANRGYREYTEHMCSLESELENQMGEFHIKMKGLVGYARLCAGDQYEVLMRYGRQRWRMKGRVEVSSKQVWDSEDNVFLPLITELLSIKVTELKSLANHVVVGSVSCETLDLFSPLPQTVAVDINDLGTVKLNLEVTWSPFDKDDQTSSSTVSKRFLSNQSPPDTPSMREQVFYSLLRRQGELENGTVWSNSSESSDDSSSPAMGHAHRLMASHSLQATPTIQIPFSPRQSSVSTPSLSSNQEEEEADAAEGFSETDSEICALPNGHLKCSRSLTNISERAKDCAATVRLSDQPFESSETPESLPCTKQDRPEALDLNASGGPESCGSIPVDQGDTPSASTLEADKLTSEAVLLSADSELIGTYSAEHSRTLSSTQLHELGIPEEAGCSRSRSSSFTQDVETALESFDFLNCADLDDDEEEQGEEEQGEEEQGEEEQGEEEQGEEEPVGEESGEEEQEEEQEEDEKEEEEQKQDGEYEIKGLAERDDFEDDVVEIIVEAPEGFRNEDCPPLDAECSSEDESSEQFQFSSETKGEVEEDERKKEEVEENDVEQNTETGLPVADGHGKEAS
ncbi:rho family-interacting cell polarization regulator 1-like isoform X2 [Esox lucius]|uniref:rho family-interacting cell polarization regulator 1-like isoform X2 n=1 Tax=Esox lucius TaxID=8010 RepID=UPI001476B292|nr:rho family-interacting cell polarization regulator 1-like isoform X2 [Esox lucius]